MEVAEGGGGYRLVAFPEERKRIDIGDFYSDYSKIRERLGWEPRIDLKEGLTRSVEYYLANIQHYLEER